MLKIVQIFVYLDVSFAICFLGTVEQCALMGITWSFFVFTVIAVFLLFFWVIQYHYSCYQNHNLSKLCKVNIEEPWKYPVQSFLLEFF